MVGCLPFPSTLSGRWGAQASKRKIKSYAKITGYVLNIVTGQDRYGVAEGVYDTAGFE